MFGIIAWAMFIKYTRAKTIIISSDIRIR